MGSIMSRIDYEKAIELLTVALKDPDSGVRRCVLEALQGKTVGEKSIEPMIAALKDSDALVRMYAEGVLYSFINQNKIIMH
jgi:HEAT repeat protein